MGRSGSRASLPTTALWFPGYFPLPPVSLCFTSDYCSMGLRLLTLAVSLFLLHFRLLLYGSQATSPCRQSVFASLPTTALWFPGYFPLPPVSLCFTSDYCSMGLRLLPLAVSLFLLHFRLLLYGSQATSPCCQSVFASLPTTALWVSGYFLLPPVCLCQCKNRIPQHVKTEGDIRKCF